MRLCPLSLTASRILIVHHEHPLLRPRYILGVEHTGIEANPESLGHLSAGGPIERTQEIESRREKLLVSWTLMGHQPKRGLDEHSPLVPLFRSIQQGLDLAQAVLKRRRSRLLLRRLLLLLLLLFLLMMG